MPRSKPRSRIDRSLETIELDGTVWMPSTPPKAETLVKVGGKKKRYKLANKTRYWDAGSLEWDDERGVMVPKTYANGSNSKPGMRTGDMAPTGLFLNPNSTRNYVFKNYRPGKRKRDMYKAANKRDVHLVPVCRSGEIPPTYRQLQREVATLNTVIGELTQIAIAEY